MEKKRARMKLMSMLCFLFALALIGLYFLPLWSYTDYSATREEESAAQALLDSNEATDHFTVQELVSPSLFTETKYYYFNGEEHYSSAADPHREAILSTVFMALPAAAGILAALLALAKLPVLMLITEAAGAAAFCFDMNYIGAAGKITYTGYSAGIAYQAYLPCFAVLGFLTILLLIFKGSFKRALKAER